MCTRCRCTHELNICKVILERFFSRVHACVHVDRDSSAVRRLFVRLAGVVGRQSALYKKNSGFAAPTLGCHISTFCGYRILFSIRNPSINQSINQSKFYLKSVHFITIQHKLPRAFQGTGRSQK